MDRIFTYLQIVAKVSNNNNNEFRIENHILSLYHCRIRSCDHLRRNSASQCVSWTAVRLPNVTCWIQDLCSQKAGIVCSSVVDSATGYIAPRLHSVKREPTDHVHDPSRTTQTLDSEPAILFVMTNVWLNLALLGSFRHIQCSVSRSLAAHLTLAPPAFPATSFCSLFADVTQTELRDLCSVC
jgi:hypothetical protein